MYKYILILCIFFIYYPALAEVGTDSHSNLTNGLSFSESQSIQSESSIDDLVKPVQLETTNDTELAYFPIAVRYVKNSRTSVYSKPTTNSKILFELSKNKKVLIYDRVNDWERISSPSNPDEWAQNLNLCESENCKNVELLNQPITNSYSALNSNSTYNFSSKFKNAKSNNGSVKVGGYYRNNGTYVRSYNRSYKSYLYKNYSRKSRRR